jgi:hypothetical protein
LRRRWRRRGTVSSPTLTTLTRKAKRSNSQEDKRCDGHSQPAMIPVHPLSYLKHLPYLPYFFGFGLVRLL